MILLAKFEPHIYAIFRIVAGFMYMLHGTQKLFRFPTGQKTGEGPALLSVMGIGGILEFLCGLLVMVGFYASPAAFIASGTMAVAYFGWHQAHGILPIQNEGEKAALYSFIFLFISAYGSGILSIDDAMKKE